MTYGVYVLSRLVATDEAVWDVIQRSMNDLLALSLTIVTEFFEAFEVVPFGLTLQDVVSYAMSRFARRSACALDGRGSALCGPAHPGHLPRRRTLGRGLGPDWAAGRLGISAA